MIYDVRIYDFVAGGYMNIYIYIHINCATTTHRKSLLLYSPKLLNEGDEKKYSR